MKLCLLCRISHHTGPIDSEVFGGADIPVCPACQHVKGRQELSGPPSVCDLYRALKPLVIWSGLP